MKLSGRWILAGLLMAMAGAAAAQVRELPPTPAAPPAAPKPSTHPTAVIPSAGDVFKNIQIAPSASTSAPAADAGGVNVVPQTEPVAPNTPPAMRIREGDFIWKRTGRLIKDESTGAMLFAFDSDGKQMADPPMGIVPCEMLAVMEDQSDKGTRPVKFMISAEVTQYRGKNYLYIKFAQTVKDINTGIGSGG